MNHTEETITEEIKQIFEHVRPILEKRFDKSWQGYEIENVWSHQVIAHQTFYHYLIKMGTFPNVHHYTVEVETMPHSYKLISVQEGKKTVF